MKTLNKKIKKFDAFDISLIKISAIFFVLFLINVWSHLLDLVQKVHWWWFLAIAILAMIRPMKKLWVR